MTEQSNHTGPLIDDLLDETRGPEEDLPTIAMSDDPAMGAGDGDDPADVPPVPGPPG